MTTEKSNHYLGLDILRFISAVLVLFSHIIVFSNFIHNDFKVHAYVIASFGVEIFFCLSGFLICRQGVEILKNKNKISYNASCFVSRRIMRTWPAYYLSLLCYTIFYNQYSLDLIPYLFFTQNLYYPMVSESFFSVSWSITVEELFYILFPLLILFFYNMNVFNIRKLDSLNIILLVCIFIVVFLFIAKIFIGFEKWGPEIRRVAVLRIDAIAFGGVAYILFRKFRNFSYFHFLNALVFFFSFTVSYCFLILIADKKGSIDSLFSSLTLLTLSLSSATLVILFCRLKASFKRKSIELLANTSYPIYLMHILVIDLINRITIKNFYFEFALITISSLFLAIMIRIIIEEPIISKRPRYK